MSRTVLTNGFDEESHDQSQGVPAKIAYAKPVLVGHGNLREITLTTGPRGRTTTAVVVLFAAAIIVQRSWTGGRYH